jgi:pyruvate,water dikinase
MSENGNYIRWFDSLGMEDVPLVGGKNASLGEMISSLRDEGVRVPNGFATTAEAYRQFVAQGEIKDEVSSLLDELKDGDKTLETAGKKIRRLFTRTSFPGEIEEAIRKAYRELCEEYGKEDLDVAVRSSATAEDLPDASFAGQQETFLNVTGEDELLDSCRRCFASLFTDRAISYRNEKGFEHMKVALSVGVQKMVRADEAGSGVMFSIDTETGFRDVVVINASWGLGENVVQGAVNPDEYVVFKKLLKQEGVHPIIGKTRGAKEKKMVYARGGSRNTKNVDTSHRERISFVLSDEEILQLGNWATGIEKHYEKPMDMEWAKDGETGDLFILQARPETVQSAKKQAVFKTYRLKERGEELLSGLAIGDAIAGGSVQVIERAEDIHHFEEGSLLVTGMTDPDWVPIMKKSAGIITDHGGRTSHAAIVSRELGVAAIVGTGDATQRLKDGQEVTISCAEGDRGIIYEGILDYEEEEINLEKVPDSKTDIMINIASPAAAFRWWRLPCRGIGLARMEFIINNIIKIHPMALVGYDELDDQSVRYEIDDLTRGFEDKSEYFVDHLSRGIARIAASQYPHRVIVRMSDFKTNEYANLIGGTLFEPEEDNPMLGFRGASRYYSERYRRGFGLECRAIKRAREDIGLRNIAVMIPFCRTLKEADKVLQVLEEHGLKRGKGDLELYVMAEVPSNVILAEEFAKRFDGFSIGSNDLTQLVLGIDRDSDELAPLFDERDEAVKKMVATLIEKAHRQNRKVGICGQAPSDHPEFATFLQEAGIDSISLNPDSVVGVIEHLADRND